MPPQTETMDPHRSSLPQPGRNADENDNNSNVVLPDNAPRSVYLTPEPLTRDLSDLSGSYANGASGNSVSVPRMIYSQQVPASGAWRQAYVVSRPPPPSSNAKTFPASPSSIGVSRSASIMASRDESVEFINERHKEDTLDLDTLEMQTHNRIPVNVLLMDASRNTYEIMQVWIDRAVDSVRDVVQAVQRGIPEQWKTAYDGIFQMRGNSFTQLIHILRMAKYDIQPHEILVAKPWSMTAKVAISFANSAIRHLANIQIINTDEEDKLGRRISEPKPEGSPLVLSNVAQKRIYSPHGVLSHHHATQFLTFSPPFDTMVHTREPLFNDDAVSALGSNTSSVTGPQFQGNLVEDLIATILSKAKKPISPRYPTSEEESSQSSIVSLSHQALNKIGSRSRRNNVSYALSQLNCFKTRERVAALACCPHQPPKDGKEWCCNVKDWNNAPLLAVDEEEGPSIELHPTGHDKPDASHPPNHHHHRSGSQQFSSEDVWLQGVESEHSPKYVTRGKKRFLRLEI